MTDYDSMEPMLQPNPYRFSLFPIQPQYSDIRKLYMAVKAQTWPASEIDLSKDASDWQKLTEGERHFMSMVLAFFASSDGIVMENLGVNFAYEVQVPEIRQLYAYIGYNEAEHSEAYALMIDTVIPDPVEKQKLFHAITEFRPVQRLAQWAMKWMDAKKHPFRVRLVGFVIYEGLVFSSKFAAIFWLKKRGKLPGIAHGNVLISRDESGHETTGVMINSKLRKPCEPEIVRAMVEEVVAIDAEEFMSDALSVDLIGMNKELMVEYIKIVADRILVRLGCAKIYNITTPNMLIDMMDTIAMENKFNFFEGRNPVYQKSSVLSKPTPFKIEDDF